MAINGNEVKFYSADLNQSGIIESSVESGSIVYSTIDKALYLIDGENGQIGRTAHLISNIIESSSRPDLSNLSNHSPEKALYKYNDHLHYYNNSTLYQLVNAGELTEVSDRVTALEESTFLTSDELDSILNNKNYITNDVLEGKNYVSNTELNNYVTVEALNEANYVDTDALNNTVKNFITAEALTDYAKTEDLSDFVSANDLSIYAKTADIENTYAKTAALNSYLTKLEAEQQYLTQNDVDGVYATVESMEAVSGGVSGLNTTVGNHTKSINEINTKISDIQSSAGTVGGLVDNHTAAINNLKTFTGYSNENELKAENFKSLDARLDTLEANYTTLDGNVSGKLNASGGTSTNLTENTQLVVGTKDDTRLELSKSSIKKYTSSTDTTGTSVLFKGDVSVSENGNSYTINDGTNSITINIPSDLVVSSGTIETNPTDQLQGTYLVLTLNDANKDKIYIDVKDLANDYTAASDSTNPVQLTLDSSTHEFKAVLTGNSVTSDYLANDIELSTLIIPSIKGSSATTPAAITINGGTIDSTGAIAQAVNLTDGKSISISGDISGIISNVGTSNSSGELTLPAVNTSADANTKIVTITPTMADTSKDDLKINIPNFVANQKGLITSASTTSVSIGAVNTVKKSEDTDTAGSKPIAFMAGADNTNDTLSYNSGVTITPKDKKITATTFSGDLNGNADTATAFSAGQTVSITGGATGSVSSTGGWTVPVTLNSKLIAGSSKTAVADSATTNDTTYLNLYAPNASNTDTVLSSLQLKGSGATTISATNGAITITSTDYSNAIAAAQSNAINTASADATTKANTAKTDAINNAATLYLTKSNPTGTGSFSLNRKADTTIGNYSFAEGYDTIAFGNYGSHAEGYYTTAFGVYGSHAEGQATIAYGTASHAEGRGANTVVIITGDANVTTYTVSSSTANSSIKAGQVICYENTYAKITAYDSSVPSITVDTTLSTTAISSASATVYKSTASGNYSHAEGDGTLASGNYSHAEGYSTTASGQSSHAEGYQAAASGMYSHAEGYQATASGNRSHAEGANTTASGNQSHAEGYFTKASGSNSHAEGRNTTASGSYSHASGSYTTANTQNMFVIGSYNNYDDSSYYVSTSTSSQDWSISRTIYIFDGVSQSDNTFIANSVSRDYVDNLYVGDYFYTSQSISTTIYKCTDYEQLSETRVRIQYTAYTIKDPHTENGTNIFVVGNGTSPSALSNAHTLDWSGNAWFAGNVYVGGTDKDNGSLQLATIKDTEEAAKTVYNTIMPNADYDSTSTYYLLAREVDGMDTNAGESGNIESKSHENIYFTDTGKLYANKVYGSVWNDYAEYRQTHHKVRPGQCVYEKGDGSLAISYERMMPGANIVSDTFGFAIGETNKCKTPLAVSGRVLAYPYEPKETYNPGDAVCSGPNGTISKMTRAEIRDYPERIVGTVSEIPTYEIWGSGNVKVNGRIWIKVR